MILFPLGSMPILDFTIKTEVGHSSWYVCTMKCLRFRNNNKKKTTVLFLVIQKSIKRTIGIKTNISSSHRARQSNELGDHQHVLLGCLPCMSSFCVCIQRSGYFFKLRTPEKESRTCLPELKRLIENTLSFFPFLFFFKYRHIFKLYLSYSYFRYQLQLDCRKE